MNNEAAATNKALFPYILIQPYRLSVTIGKDVVKCLGFPTYLSLRINEQKNTLALIPCEEKSVLSFKVPEKLLTDHHTVFRINSKSFVMTLLTMCGLSENCIYECKGVFSEKVNAVIFSLDKSGMKERELHA